ncbi:MAG: Fe-S cluster assembly scaffold protein NifU [Candidatus Solincola sediminis]|uniref:Fe-S cluster assembly scaffold protein NifU n=1 Tax=Candidatus Solincola sediminis TaxID=1797199 RepID=A0A1F2WFP6_9ACTN|nr:MAG: Fe-S cluster assembly scaffold protein NifU [Candidatus Solincola sediminis]OFW58091.1 MAG: Fe-S cluster assembly scaffold protein NifU [Candidatus Solincola sediminis]
MYSDKVIDHFQNPRNVGDLPDCNGIGKVGNQACGDMMEVYIKVEEGRLADIKYKTFGCGAAVASGSMGTEMAKGMTIEEAMKITNRQVAKALDGLPPEKMHCSNLAADGIRTAIEDYFSKQKIGKGE